MAARALTKSSSAGEEGGRKAKGVSLSASDCVQPQRSALEGGCDAWELGKTGGDVSSSSSLVLQMFGRDQGLGQFLLSSPMFALMVTGHRVLFIVQIPDMKPDTIYLL